MRSGSLLSRLCEAMSDLLNTFRLILSELGIWRLGFSGVLTPEDAVAEVEVVGVGGGLIVLEVVEGGGGWIRWAGGVMKLDSGDSVLGWQSDFVC